MVSGIDDSQVGIAATAVGTLGEKSSRLRHAIAIQITNNIQLLDKLDPRPCCALKDKGPAFIPAVVEGYWIFIDAVIGEVLEGGNVKRAGCGYTSTAAYGQTQNQHP